MKTLLSHRLIWKALRIACWTAFLLLGLSSEARATMLGCTGLISSFDWQWYDPDQNWMESGTFTGTISDHVDSTGHIDSFVYISPGVRAGLGWLDQTGVPLQGDGRYLGFTGTVILQASYYSAPNLLSTLTLVTVHYTAGVADGAWHGTGPLGNQQNTGFVTMTKLGVINQNRLNTIGGPVQIATGAEAVTRPLFTFDGARHWRFALNYNSVLASGQKTPGPVGYGWAHNFEASLASVGANLVLHWDQTRSDIFTPVSGSPNTFVSTDDATRYDTITVQSGGGWLLVHRGQSSLRFDSNGRLIEDRDSQGRKLTLTYDSQSRLSSIADPVSSTSLAFSYVPGSATISTITDAAGAIVSLSYASGQLLGQIVNQNGKQVSYAYDSNRALLTETDANGAVLTMNSYATSGRVATQDDGISANQVMRFVEAEYGLPGNTVYSASDTQQHVPLPVPTSNVVITSFTGLSNQPITYYIDASGNLVSATVNGQTTSLTYDANGNVVSVTDPSGQSTTIVPRIVVAVTDRTGHVFTYTFDPAYHLLSLENPLGQTVRYTYDAQGNPTSATDALNRTSSSTYDAQGNLLTHTDPAGKVTTLTYDTCNNLLTATDPAGQITTNTYDSSNNLLSVTDALGHTTTWTYDANSLPLTMTLPGGGVYHYTYTSGRPLNYPHFSALRE